MACLARAYNTENLPEALTQIRQEECLVEDVPDLVTDFDDTGIDDEDIYEMYATYEIYTANEAVEFDEVHGVYYEVYEIVDEIDEILEMLG